MEHLLLDQKFWLTSLEEDVAIEVSIQEDTLNLFYKGILMQDGKWWVDPQIDSSLQYLNFNHHSQHNPPTESRASCEWRE